MKIITASNGKKKICFSKKDWYAIGLKAGWVKKSPTFSTPEGIFETPYDDSDVPIPQKAKPVSEEVIKSISQEPQEEIEVPKPKPAVKSWLDEPEKPITRTPLELLQDKVDEVLQMEIPIVLARGLELTDLGNKTFLLEFGKKKFKGKPVDILRALHQIKKEYSDPFEEIGE